MKRLLTLLTLIVMTAAANAVTKAQIKTSLGIIDLELDEAKAPITVRNFVDYAKSGFYDDIIDEHLFAFTAPGKDENYVFRTTGAGAKLMMRLKGDWTPVPKPADAELRKGLVAAGRHLVTTSARDATGRETGWRTDGVDIAYDDLPRIEKVEVPEDQITRWLLWEEQNHVCLYTGKEIE